MKLGKAVQWWFCRLSQAKLIWKQPLSLFTRRQNVLFSGCISQNYAVRVVHRRQLLHRGEFIRTFFLFFNPFHLLFVNFEQSIWLNDVEIRNIATLLGIGVKKGLKPISMCEHPGALLGIEIIFGGKQKNNIFLGLTETGNLYIRPTMFNNKTPHLFYALGNVRLNGQSFVSSQKRNLVLPRMGLQGCL